MKVTYTHLSFDRVSKDYKLSLRKFVHWLESKPDLIEGFGAMEGDGEKYKKDPKGFHDLLSGMMPSIVQNDPRKLYEFFDENNIRISITEHPDSSDDLVIFTYFNSTKKTSKVVDSRGEAEQEAFYDAFAILEEKIKEIKT